MILEFQSDYDTKMNVAIHFRWSPRRQMHLYAGRRRNARLHAKAVRLLRSWMAAYQPRKGRVK